MNRLKPKMLRHKKKYELGIVFGFSIFVAILFTVSILFPALMAVYSSETKSNVDPFERSGWDLPLLVTYVTLAVFAIFYFTKKLPNVIVKTLKNILNFEISQKVAFIVIAALLTIYISFSIGELGENEIEQIGDFASVEKGAESYPYSDDGSVMIFAHVRYFLLHVSQEILGNVKIIPFVSSIALLVTTYFFTAKIAKKRFAGIIAMIVLLQSSTFLKYDTIASYTTFWILFYLLSIYLMHKKWYSSPMVYVLSIFSKPLTLFFFPMTFYYIFNSEITKRRKIQLAIAYILVVTMVFGIGYTSVYTDEKFLEFNYENFWSTFSVLTLQLRVEWLIVLFLVPLIVGLFLLSRKGILVSNSVMLLIMFSFFIAPILSGLADYTTQPYRHIAFIVFFAVGFGMMFCSRKIPENKIDNNLGGNRLRSSLTFGVKI